MPVEEGTGMRQAVGLKMGTKRAQLLMTVAVWCLRREFLVCRSAVVFESEWSESDRSRCVVHLTPPCRSLAALR
jgi:hypothetical protein